MLRFARKKDSHIHIRGLYLRTFRVFVFLSSFRNPNVNKTLFPIPAQFHDVIHMLIFPPFSHRLPTLLSLNLGVGSRYTFLLLGWPGGLFELSLSPSRFCTRCWTGVRMSSAPLREHRSRRLLRPVPLVVKSAGNQASCWSIARSSSSLDRRKAE